MMENKVKAENNSRIIDFNIFIKNYYVPKENCVIYHFFSALSLEDIGASPHILLFRVENRVFLVWRNEPLVGRPFDNISLSIL